MKKVVRRPSGAEFDKNSPEFTITFREKGEPP